MEQVGMISGVEQRYTIDDRGERRDPHTVDMTNNEPIQPDPTTRTLCRR
jgi:hypothetical protein